MTHNQSSYNPPRQIGVRHVTVVGKLLLFKDDQPAMFEMKDSLFRYIALFDDEGQIEGFSKFCDLEWDSIKIVTGDDFLKSFKGTDIRPITNIRSEDGKLRWSQLPVGGDPGLADL